MPAGTATAVARIPNDRLVNEMSSPVHLSGYDERVCSISNPIPAAGCGERLGVQNGYDGWETEATAKSTERRKTRNARVATVGGKTRRQMCKTYVCV